MQLITEIQCFGTIQFWSSLINAESILLEQHEFYQKTGYRNKYRLLTANGSLLLSIPLVGGRRTKEKIQDVKIDYSTQWQKQHWRTLESAYNKSAFFFFYSDFLRDLLLKKHCIYLWDFNLETIYWLNRQFKNACTFQFTQAYVKKWEDPFVTDIRGTEDRSKSSQLATPTYFQVFGERFVPNLCILDMLFNVGPATYKELRSIG